MNEYLIRSEKTALRERVVVEELHGGLRWQLAGPSDILRGGIAGGVGLLLSLAAYAPLPWVDDLSAFATFAGIAAVAALAWVIDRALLSRFTLRDAIGQAEVTVRPRFVPFRRRFGLHGRGGIDAELRIGRKRTALELSGHPPIELVGSAADGLYHLVRSGREVARISTWSRNREDSITLRVEPGPHEAVLVAAAAVLDRAVRKGRLPEPPFG